MLSTSKVKHTKLMLIVLLLWTASCRDTEFQGYNGGGGSRDSDDRTTQDTPTSTTQTNNPGTTTDIPRDKPAKGFDLEFGKLMDVWHIGDNNYDATDCKFRIAFNKIDSRQFNFNFYVEQDNTQVNIKVYHCGVDEQFANKNPVTLIGPAAAQGGQGPEISRMTLPESKRLLIMKSLDFPMRFTLVRGWYKIRIETSLNPANNDYDDFIVKSKLINASGPIQLGEVTVN